VEREEGLMRRAAELLARFDLSVSLLTKSALVLRDLDLWRRVNRRGGFNLYVSLGFARDEPRRIYEPGASSVQERLEALKRFREAGCRTGIMALPLLPYIGDTEGNLRALLEMAVDAGVDFFMPGGLTLRPGRQKDHFFRVLEEHDPDLVPRYRELYAANRQCGSCIRAYRESSSLTAGRITAEYGLPEEIPHELYRSRLPLYDEIYVLLSHMIILYGRRGTDTHRLRAALRRYRQWLVERKKVFNRRRKTTQEEVEEELRLLLGSGGMADVIRNEKLSDFMRRVVVERRLFDYRRLELTALGSASAETPWDRSSRLRAP